MTRLATTPVCPTCSAIQRVVTFLNKFLPRLMDTRIVGRQKEGIEGARRLAPHGSHTIRPLCRNAGRLRVECHHVATSPCMRHIIGLCVQAHRLCTIFSVLEFLNHRLPRGAAHILQYHNWRTMLFDPIQHAMERPTGFSPLLNVLLFIVKIGIVDAGCAGDEDVDITRDESLGTIGGIAVVS